jgi:acylphosphatase
MNSTDKARRLHALFSGRVQGVGFRYTVCRIADSFDVSGLVRNLWDGDVELVAEGTETVLSDFLFRIRNSPLRKYISRESVKWEEPTGEFERFGVAF